MKKILLISITLFTLTILLIFTGVHASQTPTHLLLMLVPLVLAINIITIVSGFIYLTLLNKLNF